LLSVVIATRNRAASLGATLATLIAMHSPDDGFEIVVVNNGSTDNTQDVVHQLAARAACAVREIVEPRQGKSIAVNTGIAAARGDILAFTDDDVRIDPNWGWALATAIGTTGCIGAGGRILPEWSSSPPAWLHADGSDRLMTVVAFDAGDEPGELRVAPFGPNMAFRREAFEKYGLFREDLGPGASRYLPGQDTEFGRRLLNAGERLAWVPGAIVRHVHQSEKLTKRYIASWYFGYGRMAARTAAYPPTAVRWFGVPRFLFRALLENAGHSLFATKSQRRFRYLAQACLAAGSIAETFELQRGSR
jgi:glycosyltransferase involved in cell wall biosynthesis